MTGGNKALREVFIQVFLHLLELVRGYTIDTTLRRGGTVSQLDLIVIGSIGRKPIGLKAIKDIRELMVLRGKLRFDLFYVMAGSFHGGKTNGLGLRVSKEG